jgi:hypothetical protein
MCKCLRQQPNNHHESGRFGGVEAKSMLVSAHSCAGHFCKCKVDNACLIFSCTLSLEGPYAKVVNLLQINLPLPFL